MKNFTIKNAVWNKGLVTDAKGAKLVSITLSINAIMVMVACIALIIMQVLGMSFIAISQRFLLWYFIIFVSIQSTIVFFLVPAITAGCISVEKERQTLDVLLTTRMTPWQIIKGKYASAVSVVIMLILTSIPMLSLVQIYGGISFFRMLMVIIVMITSSMFIASFGVFFSALFKNTVGSVIVTYIVVGLVLIGTFMATVVIWTSTAALSSYLYYEDYIKDEFMLAMDGVVFLCYINPIITLFDVMGQAFGYTISNSESINGMKTIMVELGEWSDKNFFTIFWTPISITLQLAITYGLLRLSSIFLNPLRGRKHKKNKNEKRTMSEQSKKVPVGNTSASIAEPVLGQQKSARMTQSQEPIMSLPQEPEMLQPKDKSTPPTPIIMPEPPTPPWN